MTRILIALLSMALVATGGLVAAIEGFASPEPVRSISLGDNDLIDNHRRDDDGHDDGVDRDTDRNRGQLERLWRR